MCPKGLFIPTFYITKKISNKLKMKVFSNTQAIQNNAYDSKIALTKKKRVIYKILPPFLNIRPRKLFFLEILSLRNRLLNDDIFDIFLDYPLAYR